ncbi:putative Ig domain-containing protein [Corynebacterium coyleae]|uniref:putative Ig domain-containing protein n=1 Tax=Corynebacterium coyleae TaxID=53374 RepID=UPI00254AE202|nr:putative Ig domain-containing protein [Corynebacterium coyleae]MDK8242008.1 putative Ig domain-containing protein [Corynebacterium coyleae]
MAQPVAFAQDEPAAVAGADAQAGDAAKDKQVSNAIFSKTGWRNYFGYHGYAYINKGGRADDLQKSNEPLIGNVIYLQYVNGKNEVSPVFYTTTDSEGRFSFDLSKSFLSRVSAPEFRLNGIEGGKTRVRVWGENPDEDKYSVVMAGDMKSGRYTTRLDRVQESWNFTAGSAGSRITNGRFVLEEKPNHVGWLAKPEDQWTRALDGETGEPTVDGQFPDYGRHGAIDGGTRIWWESGEDAGSLPSQYAYDVNQGDRAAGGVEIVASYLNDEVARQIDAWKDANPGYTVEQERENQKRIIDAYQGEHGVGSHIAETVVAPSKADGTFFLPFKGTYGQSRTRENQPAQISNKLEEGDFGTVAKDFMPDNGASRYAAFSDGLINQTKKRHVNTDYMYIYPRIEGRDVKLSSFPVNMFQNIKDLGSSGTSNNMGGIRFPLMSAQPIFDIPEYNSYDNKGRAGSKVTTKTAGLMPNADYAIRWYATTEDGTQEELEDAMCIVKSDDKGALPSCDFQAPEDLKETTVYTAAVVSVDPVSKKPSDRWEIADSFTAVVPEQLPLGSTGEEYPDNDVTPLFKEKLDEGAKPTYSADNLPDGLEIDPETGKITGTPTKPGTTEVTVTREVEVEVEKYVPVLDEQGDPVYENPDEEDPEKRVEKTEPKKVTEKQYERVITKITVTDTKLADGFVGEPYEQEVKPEGFDKLPQGFELKKDSIKVEGLPAGLEYKDGKITGTPTEKVEASEEKPNVTVTYTLVDQDGNETEHTDMVPLSVGVKTTVDSSGVKPVDPTDQEQDTGIKVTNPDNDTKVSAKDEDGNDVPVKIDEDGNVVVTPGKGVDGPITVTITDPDLPDGKVEVEVPVNGHEKDRDDNGSETQPGVKTTVDDSNVTPVDPTDQEQDTGIKVTNPDNDTKVSAKDEDGNDVPVKIDEDGNVVVTPGEKVDGPITVTIEDPDLDGGKVEVEVPVNGHEKGKDDNGSDKTTVDSSNVIPVDPTNDPQDTGIKVTNPDDDTKVTAKDEDGNDVPVKIDEDGNVIVTPGENVDGPIDVTITDPDLPGGKTEIEVPVNGHEKNQDDNGSDASDDKTTVDETGKTPVDPTDEKQGTGVVVENEDDETKVTAKDEDGKDVPVVINPDTGEIEVTPGEDVDGPINVTIEDPDLPNSKVEVEIDVNGHEKNRDDNGSDPANEDGTTVDGSNITPVNPTDDKQDTGIKVTNPDEDTKVTAKDEDGNDVPVEIDENGNVAVTPGTDVDGPITVTVEDPDLPNGKAEFEVPVNGHEKGRDDNGSDASDKTTVDQNDKKSVDPTDEKQGTGVKVTNPDKDTKVSAKDEDGKDIPVEIDPNTGEIVVTPGKDVDGPITVTIEDPDLDGGKTEIEIDVNGHEKGRDDNGSGASDDKTTVSPGKSTVTPNGKGQNVGKVDQGNSDKKGELTGELVDKDGNLIKGAKVTIDKDGNIIVSVPKGTPAGEAWVVVKEDGKEIHRFKIQIGETIDTGKCVATSVGFGLPLIALLPLGLATQIEIPGLSDFAAQANAQIQNVNTQLQQQLGIFNPQLAAQVEGLNKQLGQYGTDIATVAGGLALIAAGILAGTIIYDNCTPGGGSSVKDLELKGSSGKTYAGSSKEEKAQPKK